jgi:hypothetical protein
VDGTLAAARGQHTTAALRYLDAAQRYAAVGSTTDRMLALGGVVRALSAAADEGGSAHIPGPRPASDDRLAMAAPSWTARTDAHPTVGTVPVTQVRSELDDFARRNRIVSAL